MSADVRDARRTRDVVFGVDIGGTRVKAGAVDALGAVSDEAVWTIGDTEIGRTPEALAHALARWADAIDPSRSVPVGVAVAGVIDQGAGLIRESPNFPAWRDVPFARIVADASQRRVVLENDANAVVLGEAVWGAGRGAESLVGYTLGTGVGGGIILEGQLWRGVRGMAGELGHVTVVPDGRACGCGNHGCLEQYVGRVGIAQTWRALAADARGVHPALTDAMDDSDIPAALARAAADGHLGARAIWNGVGRFLGQAAAALVHTLDVQRIVVAGGVAGAFGHFAPAMEAEIRARTFRSMAAGVVVAHGTLGVMAGIVGASAVARSALEG